MYRTFILHSEYNILLARYGDIQEVCPFVLADSNIYLFIIKTNVNSKIPFIMKVVCHIRHKPLHSFFHIRRLQFLFWPFEHPESMRRKWIEICKVLFILFLQTFYSKLPIGFPATICTSITALKFFRFISIQLV